MVRDAVPEGVAAGEDAARLESKTDAGLAGKIGSECGRLEARPTVRLYGGSVAASAVALALVELLP